MISIIHVSFMFSLQITILIQVKIQGYQLDFLLPQVPQEALRDKVHLIRTFGSKIILPFNYQM